MIVEFRIADNNRCRFFDIDVKEEGNLEDEISNELQKCRYSAIWSEEASKFLIARSDSQEASFKKHLQKLVPSSVD